MSNDVQIIILILPCVLVPGSQVSYVVKLIKKKTECFLSLLVVLQRLVSEPPGSCLGSGTLEKKRKSKENKLLYLFVEAFLSFIFLLWAVLQMSPIPLL